MIMNKSSFKIIHLICYVCLLYVIVSCAQTQSKGTDNTVPPVRLSGCYSSLYYNEEGGDYHSYSSLPVLRRTMPYFFSL